jgi:hypothetical protein
LDENDAMAQLIAQHQTHARLHQIFAETLPPGWDSMCRVASLEGSTVIIAAANGAVATRLKAFLPRLLENFQNELKKKTKQEQEVTSIRVVVQPEISSWRAPTLTSARLAARKTPISAEQLSDLAGKLADSPLKKAILRIQAKQKRAPQDK